MNSEKLIYSPRYIGNPARTVTAAQMDAILNSDSGAQFYKVPAKEFTALLRTAKEAFLSRPIDWALNRLISAGKAKKA